MIVDAVQLQNPLESVFEGCLRAALLLGHHGCGNTSTLGPLQGIGPSMVGHHQGNLAVGDATGGLCIQKGLEIGAAAGYKYCNL